MPFEKQKKSKGKKEEEDGGFGGWLKGQASDLADVAAGTPGAAIQMAKDVHALRSGDPRGLINQGKAQLDAVKALGSGDDWKEHTALQLLTAAGIVAPVAKGVGIAAGAARGGTGVRAAAKAAKVPKTRTIKYKPSMESEKLQLRKTMGLKEYPKQEFENKSIPQRKDTRVDEVSVDLPKSNVWTTAKAQEGMDKLREQFPAWQKKKVLKGVARDRDILDRIANPALQETFLASLKTAGKKESFGELKKKGWNIPQEVNAGVRAARLYRPGYIAPNLLGSNLTNLIEMGPRGTFKAGQSSRRMRGEGNKQKLLGKDITPERQEALDVVDAVMGEGAAAGAAELGGAGPVATVTRGMGQTLGKVTDREARRRHFFGQAAKQGYKDENAVLKMIQDAKGNPASQASKDLVQIARRAEPAAIRFTRTRNLPGVKKSKAQSLDSKLSNNIFLYRWLTGSGAYTGRMLTEHPTLSAVMANAPEGPKIDDVLTAYPKFMSRYIPTGKFRDKMPEVSNLQAATLFDSPGELVELIKRVADDPRNIIDPLAPFQRAIGVGGLGYDPFRGQELSTRSNPTPSIVERLGFGADVETRSIPYRSMAEQLMVPESDRTGKLFPRTNKDLFKTFMFGGPVPTPVNPKVAKDMAKNEEIQRKKGKRSKKKSAGF